jgi:hypothetical protein
LRLFAAQNSIIEGREPAVVGARVTLVGFVGYIPTNPTRVCQASANASGRRSRPDHR